MLSPINILKALPDISIISSFLPVIIGYSSFSSVKRNIFLVFILINLACLTEIISQITPYIGFKSNIIFINIYFLFEIGLTTMIYLKLNSKNNWRFFILVSGSLLILNAIYHLVSKQRNTLDNVQMTLESLFMISVSLVVFYAQLKELKYSNITDVPMFWVNSAFLIFFGGNLFLHAFSNYLVKYELYSFFELWGIIHSLLNITFCFLISIAFWKSRKFRA